MRPDRCREHHEDMHKDDMHKIDSLKERGRLRVVRTLDYERDRMRDESDDHHTLGACPIWKERKTLPGTSERATGVQPRPGSTVPYMFG
jgi:hypothetical protein